MSENTNPILPKNAEKLRLDLKTQLNQTEQYVKLCLNGMKPDNDNNIEKFHPLKDLILKNEIIFNGLCILTIYRHGLQNYEDRIGYGTLYIMNNNNNNNNNLLLSSSSSQLILPISIILLQPSQSSIYAFEKTSPVNEEDNFINRYLLLFPNQHSINEFIHSQQIVFGQNVNLVSTNSRQKLLSLLSLSNNNHHHHHSNNHNLLIYSLKLPYGIEIVKNLSNFKNMIFKYDPMINQQYYGNNFALNNLYSKTNNNSNSINNDNDNVNDDNTKNKAIIKNIMDIIRLSNYNNDNDNDHDNNDNNIIDLNSQDEYNQNSGHYSKKPISESLPFFSLSGRSDGR